MSDATCKSLKRFRARAVRFGSLGAWAILAATPLIVVVCALHG
ncbi:hypothetical protein [Neokomagataea tanensis]|nr:MULTISPECIES: hypothetical protein [Neokomagataea]